MSVASLYTGISGINANLKVLSVIGNNIANINTFGFKGSRVAFADILSQSLTGSSQIGLGVKLSSVQKSFTQGAFQATNNILDLGISGDGFYMVNDPIDGSPFYSRAGMFHLDKDGYIVNPENLKLQGYMANSSGVLQNTVTDLVISGATIPPNTTSTVTITANLDSNSPITGFVFTTGTDEDITFSDDNGTTWYTADLITNGGLTSGAANTGAAVATAIKTAMEATNGTTDTYTVGYDDQTGLFTIANDTGNGILVLDWDGSSGTTTAETLLGFTAADSTVAAGASDVSDNAGGAFVLASAGDTSNFSTPVTVYDSLGNSHVITMYFRKDSLGGTGNVWEWFATVPATDSTSGSTEIQAQGTATFNTSGALYQEATTSSDFDFTGGPGQSQSITFDYGESIVQGGSGADGTTQYGTDSGVAALAQDGYASGTLGSIAVSQDGTISGVYSNGRTLTLAQVLLASFASVEGLQSAGNNVYTESFDSGQPLIGAPGSSSRGFVQSNTLELSNVDMAEQFVGMITAQRGFQASSRVITTTDDLLAELVNLKR